MDLKLERNFTFSSSACDFLRKNNFDFGRIFTDGVPYLSRREKRDVELDYSLRESRNANIPDISVSANDTTNLEFVRNARKTIAYWISHPKVRHHCCAGLMSAKIFAGKISQFVILTDDVP